jgi:ATP-dependent helicase HrpA
MDDFRGKRLVVDADAFISPELRQQLEQLPDQVTVRDRDIDIDYDVEERNGDRIGVARLRLPEKLARTLVEEEIPRLDRPVRFVVLRGQRGAVRAETLNELQDRLAQPYSPDEIEESADDRTMLSRAEREVKEIASEFRRHRRDRPKRYNERRDRHERRGRYDPHQRDDRSDDRRGHQGRRRRRH